MNKTLLLLSLLALLSSCYDTAYNPGYIISDTATEETSQEEPRP